MNADRIEAVNIKLQGHKQNIKDTLFKNGSREKGTTFKELVELVDKNLTARTKQVRILTEENTSLKEDNTRLQGELDKIIEKGLAEYMTMLSNL